MNKTIIKIGSLIFAAQFALSGCAVLVAGGAGVGTATVVEDSRTLGNQIDDISINRRIEHAMNKIPAIKESANVSAHVYNGVALLMGQVPEQKLKKEAETAARNIEHVRKIYNQIRIGTPTSASTRAYDVWLATKVRAKLLNDKEVNFLKIDVKVEDSEVFLMGMVKQAQADKAVEIARNSEGVVKVINVFEII